MTKKISSPEELLKLSEKLKAETDLRGEPKEVQIVVHMGTCGIAAGAREVLDRLADELSRASIDYVTLRQSGCIGLCDQEPMLTLIDRDGREFVYGNLDDDKVVQIVREHLLNGKPVEDLTVDG